MSVLLYSTGELEFMFATYMFVYLLILTAKSQIYKSWSLHDSDSTLIGACSLKKSKLNHKHSHSP